MMSIPINKQTRQITQGIPLHITPVEGRRALSHFIHVPWPLYCDDPAWVPPLIIERRQHLSIHNPYFKHAQYHSWIAYRGKIPVGRISAQIDDLHIHHHKNNTGFFGMLEAENNSETFQALLETAEAWLRSKGIGHIQGPFNLSINQECGLLVEGFDIPPSVMMGHALPYYGERIEEHGYQKEKDLLAYIVDTDFTSPPLMNDLMSRATRDVFIRPLRKSRFLEDVEILQDIFEDAWSQNWNFIPFTKEEFRGMCKEMKPLLDEEFVQIAEIKGEPAAMIVMIPNINEIIKDLNGRLLPLGWLKLLWRLKVKYPSSARIPLMGVRRRYQDSLVGPAIALMIINALRAPAHKRGIEKVEMSWILENNTGMRNIIEYISGTVYKRYRIYGKDLT